MFCPQIIIWSPISVTAYNQLLKKTIGEFVSPQCHTIEARHSKWNKKSISCAVQQI
jgi:hypothetical protein